jgi:type VI secretion system secreted protein VgrG
MDRKLNCFFQIDTVVADSVAGFELCEELGRPTALEIEVRFASAITSENALGLSAFFSFGVGQEEEHTFLGIVEQVTVIGSALTGATAADGSGAAHAARFRVVSQLGLLAGTVTAQIFQDKSVDEIVTEVLTSCGIPKNRQRWQLAGSYAKREYCVQYFESSLAFVSRLLEEEGIFFRSVVEDGQDFIVFSDDSPNAPSIEGAADLPMRGQTGLAVEGDAIFALRERAAIQSGTFTLRDYDFKRPQFDLTAAASAEQDSDLERYDYPGLFVDKAVGEVFARVRLESEQAERETLEVIAECARLYAGTTFKLTEFELEDDRSGTQLVTKVRHLFGQRKNAEWGRDAFGASESKTPSGYVAIVHAIPVEVPYRTRQTTPRPVVHGPQTATVTAPAGSSIEAIHTDEYARCKVRFHWDLAGITDEKSSCWIRTAQLQTSGSLALPRIGWEVVVEFLEGNPDRPLVTGKLYNGLFMPPYALPEGATRTAFSSNSSPGGGGSNSIRLEDRKGGEEVMVHAQHNQTIATANNKQSTVGNNVTRVVGGNETIDVGANATTKITMGAELTVSGNRSVTVSGNRNSEVNAVAGLTVAGSSSTSVGGAHFEMDGNPLEALLAIATEVVIDAAQAAAAQQMDRINGAIQARVDQAMAPYADTIAGVEQVASGMEAVANGDIGAIPGVLEDAANIPMPPGFGGEESAEAGAAGGDEAGGGGEGEGAGADGAEAGGEGGGEGEGREVEETEQEGGEPTDFTGMVGLNDAVDSAIDTGIRAGSAALGEALGFNSDGGGSDNLANLEGPDGNVAGLDRTDRTKGPGHSTHKVDGSYTETVGALRVQAALLEVHDEIAGNLNETIGLAKLTAVLADESIAIGGNKTLTALGKLTFTKADDSESSTGAMTNMVGGLVYDKVKGGYSITGGSSATFIGAFHKLEAKTAVTLKCGESEVVIDGSGVTIKGALVTITCGKILMTGTVAEN